MLDRLLATLPLAWRVIFPETGHMGPVTNAVAVSDLILEHMESAAAGP